MHLIKALVAEFLGTFALIFIGAGAVVALDPNNFAAIGLAHGFVIMVFVSSFSNESNAYLNPALTIGAIIAGEGRASAAIPVFLVQLAGGAVGGLALAAIYGSGAPDNLGMTTINMDMTTLAGGLTLEAIGTFFLMTVVLNSGLRKAAGNLAPFAIGMTVALCIMAFGPVTGAAVNPARTLGPAIGAGNFTQVVPYCIAQFAGAAVAAVLYRTIFARKLGDETRDDVDTSGPAF